jgi:hypothetical protein
VVNAKLGRLVKHKMGKCGRYYVRSHLASEVMGNLVDQVANEVWLQMGCSILAQTWDQLRAKIWVKIHEQR